MIYGKNDNDTGKFPKIVKMTKGEKVNKKNEFSKKKNKKQDL